MTWFELKVGINGETSKMLIMDKYHVCVSVCFKYIHD